MHDEMRTSLKRKRRKWKRNARWKAEKFELKTKKVEKKCTMKCGKVGIKNEESGKEMHDEMRKSLKRKRRK
jgi:cell wall assembly regulator SMI1